MTADLTLLSRHRRCFWLLPRNSVAATADNDVDAAPSASSRGDAPEPLATGGTHSGNELLSNPQQRRRSLGCSPEPLSVSPEALHAERAQPVPTGFAPPDGTVCNTTVLETDGASLAEAGAKHNGHGLQHDPRLSAELCGKTSNRDGTICLDNDTWDKRFPFSPAAIRRRLQTRRANKLAREAAEPDQPKSVPASRRGAQSPRSAASSLGETHQGSDTRRLSQHYDYHDGSDQTSDPEHPHPLVPNDRREVNEECSAVPSEVQESRASTPMLPDVESMSEFELATPGPSMQPSASQDSVEPQRDLDRRRHRDTDGEDYRPIVGSDAEQSKDDDDVDRQPRRKRRRVSGTTLATSGTASQQQTRSCRGGGSPSGAAQRSSRRPKRRLDRNLPNPPSSRRSALERESETDRAPVAEFEEWPLGNAILKRVTMDGSLPVFVVQFTWDPCAKHGTGHHGTEDRSSFSTAKRHRPAKQGSTRYAKDKDTTANSKPTSTPRRAKYTPEDDAKIRRLKERGLSWPAIAEHFPGRTPGAIEVRYHTKLKTTQPSRSEAPQMLDCPQTPSAFDDAGEEEWEVEEICDNRKLGDSSVELLVKWKGGEETWEPCENVAETEALDDYERLYGRLV
ncbi:hypothetical protein B0T16DRAFT_451038 [Cercophora newfieldiana]|uniref:Chromo domain-containing protein n=1 Tax=Cercophora newfieldiana TaxID=92897 RepID=A0AA39YML9_9PEZI|nr:hypothetical protein B0T16DRAFT_451038 [Cercophora newfieldiana]